MQNKIYYSKKFDFAVKILKISPDMEVPISRDLSGYLIFLKTGQKTKNYIQGHPITLILQVCFF